MNYCGGVPAVPVSGRETLPEENDMVKAAEEKERRDILLQSIL